jgi:carboxypeptidase Q
MKRLFSILLLLIANNIYAQSDSVMLRKLRDEIMLHSTCYQNLKVLTTSIGHRISGSPQAAQAVLWGLRAMKDAGADTAWLQPVWVPHWVRGQESLLIKRKGDNKYSPLRMLSLGNAVGSDGKTLEAPVIMVQTIDEFKALPKAKVKGKIVFFNYRFRQDLISTFEGYGDAIKYRGTTPALVGAKGGIAVIIRSLSTGLDDEPHTGMTRYADTVVKIPAVSLGNTGADALEQACREGTVKAQLTTNCKMMEPVLSYNVIGELRGSTHKDEYIVVGGHLDSWDVGQGAQDDGAGCVQSIEVLRAFKAIGLKPKRTIRAVLYMNEENGAKGGRAYADTAAARGERHILALESDAGGFTPRGIGLEMAADKKAIIRNWVPYFIPLNATDFTREEGGTDIDPLAKLGTPLAGLNTDPQRYFEYHHTAADLFSVVNHRELKLGAAVMASLIYLVSAHGL